MRRPGVTLLELLIVVGIIAVVALSVPALNGFQVGANLSVDGGALGRALRQAQADAESGYLNQAHGLKFFTNKAVVFVGDSYANRLTDHDRELSLGQLSLSWSLTGSGQADEIVFAKNSGRPSRAGELNLVSQQGGLAININQLGLVEWSHVDQ